MSALFYSKEIDKHWEYWYPRVYGYFFKRLDDKIIVEDLTAETLNTAFLAPNVKNLKAYLWKVAHNYLVKYINTKTTTPMMVGWDESVDLFEYQTENFEIEEEAETDRSQNYKRLVKETEVCLDQNLTKDTDKQIIHLSIIQEKNSTEIAQEMDLKAANVRQKLSRTIKKIKNKCIHIWQKFTQK